ncbi:uncharacterized protein LOC143911787 [Arctopsyche grandis]|uniref:uncharacterized protein LOC143911787 n=1 Tax=Arctopsyche grandis TaxID=121162 RepID=UPI00406D8D52
MALPFKILSSVLQSNHARNIAFINNAKLFSSDNKPKIPKNVIEVRYAALDQKKNGEVYDKKPFKLLLKKNKVYSWCLCGKSHNQPLCDGTHKDIYLKITQRPIKFQVEETKEYWLCNCKQTKHRPFCDGTHKSQEIQDTNVKV